MRIFKNKVLKLEYLFIIGIWLKVDNINILIMKCFLYFKMIYLYKGIIKINILGLFYKFI